MKRRKFSRKLKIYRRNERKNITENKQGYFPCELLQNKN